MSERKRPAPAHALWAIRVLDAYAMKHEVMVPGPQFHRGISRVDGAELDRWRVFYGLRAIGDYYAGADEARIALAEVMIADDPELARPYGGPR